MNLENKGAGIAKTLIAVLGVLVLAVMLLFFARDTSRILNWSNSGFVLSSVQQLDSSTIRFWNVNAGDFIEPVLPVRGDTLLFLADSNATMNCWIRVLESRHQPGREAVLLFRHDGAQESTTIKTRPVQPAHFFAVAILQVLRQLIFLSFMALGFWLFFKRSQAVGVRVLILYCFAVAGLMSQIYLPMFPQMASFQIPFADNIGRFLGIYSILFSSFWLLLNLVFPHPSSLYKNRPWTAHFLCFGPHTVILALSIIPVFDGPWLGRSIYFISVVQVVTGLMVLRHNHFHAQTNLEKRQTKIVFWGSGAPLLLFLIFRLEGTGLLPFMSKMDLFPRLMINNFFFLLLLATPITTTYAFRRYRLLEVEARIRRGTLYLGVTVLMLGALFGLVYLIGVLLLDNIGVTSRTPTMLIALFLALGFAPARKNLQAYLERSIFPERQRLRRMTSDFMQTASTLTDSRSLCRELSLALQESLTVRHVFPVLRRQGNGSFGLCGGGEKVPIQERSAMMAHMGREGHPLFVDEAVATSRVSFSASEWTWLESNRIALVLPLKAHEQVLGFLALGHKQDDEDYSSEEIQILASLSNQVALTLENLRLLEENLDKRRMEEELQIARRVQLRFLPQSLPDTPGLQVVARSTFSLEVAGDYYDVIPMQNGCTMMAVGDVSGKGAGAALIMANLQAALRTLYQVGLPLTEIVSRINQLITQSTDTEQFITFFVAIFDPKAATLTYVNAGHNQPLLVKADGAIRLLEAGGLILGLYSDSAYEQETLTLASQDLLLIYTDGISEAEDEAGREFGENRICKAALAGRTKSPEQILENLTRDVQAFHDDKPPDDDMTLLIAKVK
jgi:serine phosphatase RsbU (regulator of sigma subunit)